MRFRDPINLQAAAVVAITLALCVAFTFGFSALRTWIHGDPRTPPFRPR